MQINIQPNRNEIQPNRNEIKPFQTFWHKIFHQYLLYPLSSEDAKQKQKADAKLTYKHSVICFYAQVECREAG